MGIKVPENFRKPFLATTVLSVLAQLAHHPGGLVSRGSRLYSRLAVCKPSRARAATLASTFNYGFLRIVAWIDPRPSGLGHVARSAALFRGAVGRQTRAACSPDMGSTTGRACSGLMREWLLAVFFSYPLPIRCSRFFEDLLIGNVMVSLITLIRRSMFWGFTKWSLMSAALFWLLVHTALPTDGPSA